MPFGLSSGFDVAELEPLGGVGVTAPLVTTGSNLVFQVSLSEGVSATVVLEGSLDGESWFNLDSSGESVSIPSGGCLGFSLTAPVKFVRMRVTQAAGISDGWQLVGVMPDRYYSGPEGELDVNGALHDYKVTVDWSVTQEQSGDYASGWAELIDVTGGWLTGPNSLVNSFQYNPALLQNQYTATGSYLINNGITRLAARNSNFVGVFPEVKLYESVPASAPIRCLVGCC